jgi:hypothetical protein
LSLAKIQSWAKTWQREAQGADYLGQVALERGALGEVLDLLRADWCNRAEDLESVRFVLAVAAINWSYFDDHDEGFVVPFTTRLFGLADRARWDKVVGPQILRAINEWTGEDVRPDHWPFVGKVYEQTGLPLYRLEQFAELMAALRDYPDWNHVSAMRSDDLDAAITRAFPSSKYAARFLQSASGHDFIRTTCHVLLSYEAGLRSDRDLAEMPGYRRELLPLLRKQIHEISPSSRARPPVLNHAAAFLLDPKSQRLCLQLDPADVAARRITCDQHHPLLSHTLFLGLQVRLYREYTGTRTVEGEKRAWSVSAWLPTPRSWAIFSPAGALVCHNEAAIPLPAGQYFLVIDDSLASESLRSNRAITEDRGDLDMGEVDTGSFHRIFSLQLTLESAIPELGVRIRSMDSRPVLEPIGIEPWTSWVNVDAVWSAHRPRMALKGWNVEAQRQWVVLGSFGGETRRLEPDVRGTVFLDELSTPGVGRVWLEPMGRTRSVGTGFAQLTVARWPHCTISVPAELLPDDQACAVGLRLDPAVSFEVATPNECTLARSGSTWQALVHPGFHALSGKLRCGQHVLELHAPIHRARLCLARSPRDPVCVDLPTLWQINLGADDGLRDQTFVLYGRPNSELRLLLKDTADATRFRLLPTFSLGASGRCTLMANQLIGPLSDGTSPPLGLSYFAAVDGLHDVPMQAWCVTPTVLTLSDLERIAPERLPDFLKKLVADVLGVTTGQFRTPAPLEQVRPNSLRRWAAAWFYAAQALGLSRVQAGDLAWLSNDVQQTIANIAEAYRHAQSLPLSATPDQARSVYDEWTRVDPVGSLRQLGLTCATWEQRLEQELSRVRRAADVESALLDFIRRATGREAQHVTPPDVIISAGRQYARADYSRADAEKVFAAVIERLQTPAARILRAPWGELATILRLLAWLRIARPADFCEELERATPPVTLLDPWRQLTQIFRNLRSAILEGVEPPSLGGLDGVSPRPDDQKLAIVLREDASDPVERDGLCWLAAWLGWRSAFVRGLSRAEPLRQQAITKLRALPAEFGGVADIQKELAMNNPGAW